MMVIWGSASILMVSSAFGSSFGTIPSADAFVTTGPSSNLANNNYGGTGSVAVSAPGLALGEFQSVLQFNLAPAVASFNAEFGAGQWSIQLVSLQMTATAGGNPIFNAPSAGSFGVSWMQNDSWTEGAGTPAALGASGITFTTLQNTLISGGDQNLGTFSFGGGISGNNVYTLSLVSGFGADIAAGGNVSLRLFGADSAMSGVFNSRSFGTAANRPVLTVQAIPEPGTLGLFGTALVLCATRGSGRRHL